MIVPDSDPTLLRPAEPADASALAGLWAAAFPGERSAADRERTLLAGEDPHGGIECAWVAEEEGRLVGGLRTYPLELHLWGLAFPTQGLAAVAVAPEARRRGVGARICREALRIGRTEGRLLGALFPFRTDFYGRLGYTLVGEHERYRFPPEELPLFAEGERVVRLEAAEAGERVPAYFDSMLPRTNGLTRRNPRLWSHLSEEGHRVLGVPAPDGAALEGYMVVKLHPHRRPEDARLEVRELLASDTAAYRALLGWISAQRDQWRSVVYEALPGEAFHQLLGHPRLPGRRAVRGLWFQSAVLLRGPMLRVLDLPGLLEHVGFPEGELLAVDDAELPENSGQWQVSGGEVRRASDEPAGGLPVRLVSELLASGTLPGVAERARRWEPALGQRGLRFWDSF